jgi:hypothetical protein
MQPAALRSLGSTQTRVAVLESHLGELPLDDATATARSLHRRTAASAVERLV